MKLQFRIQPTKSLLDVDPPIIYKALDGLSGVADVQFFDDRASDATFVTVLVELADTSSQTLAELQAALLSICRTWVFVVDGADNETPVGTVPAAKLLDFAESAPDNGERKGGDPHAGI